MGKVDNIIKEFLNNNENFADLFNYKLYNGQQIIKPSDLQEASPEAFPTTLNGASKYRDMLKSVVVRHIPNQKTTCMLLGVEAQTNIDHTMVFRCLEYDVRRWNQELNRIIERHKTANDLPESNGITGKISLEDRLPIIVTMVVYLSEKPWTSFRTFREMLEPIPPGLESWLIQYPLFLLEPCSISEEELLRFTSPWRILLNGLKMGGDPMTAIQKAMKKPNKEEMPKVNNDILKLIPLNKEETMDIRNLPDDEKEMTVFDWLRRKCAEEHAIGVQEGKRIGKKKGEKRGEKRGIQIGEARGIQIGEARGIQIGEARGIQIGEARGEARGEERGIQIGEARGEERGEARGKKNERQAIIKQYIGNSRIHGFSEADIKKALIHLFMLGEQEAISAMQELYG